ncbi:hypothetical protein DICVIV_03527 [Dictyocaulus viviparus]|uniref:DUF1907 domain-containing protein n=1 Tax=Dictyocaulus viviparus TaxID=29172 RepID=A0A0D8Y0E7_DICVI|nr:hypothetical protein DICVIV_03527 [Dictyocaulus viviparus]
MPTNPVIIETLKPSNRELRPIVETALKTNFKNVSVEVVSCPDLSIEPFSMTSTGFGRKLVIAEVGGIGNLFPIIHKEKEFDLQEICDSCQAASSFVFGPGAGPWKLVGKNCEMIADANFSISKVATKIVSISSSDPPSYTLSILNSPKFSLMANLALSEPGTGECTANVRFELEMIIFLKLYEEGLLNITEKSVVLCVSLAGIFLLREGEAKVHVMPGFPGCSFNTKEEINKWLRFFTMKAPLVCASVVHSYDAGYKLRMEHTHCYSSHGDGGHYHYDTTPDTVVYEGWFTAAEKIFRIDEV